LTEGLEIQDISPGTLNREVAFGPLSTLDRAEIATVHMLACDLARVTSTAGHSRRDRTAFHRTEPDLS
jgi:hypothetical protein